MGYYTRVTGELQIEPPLNWAEIKDSEFAPERAKRTDLDVQLEVVEESVDTAEGELIRRTAASLVVRWPDSFKAYNLVDHVQWAIDAFPGHTFTGRLECEGEENGDLWRVVIRDGRALRIEPRIVWPDEDGAQ